MGYVKINIYLLPVIKRQRQKKTTVLRLIWDFEQIMMCKKYIKKNEKIYNFKKH